MKKESVLSYLLRFLVCNLLALLIYEGVCQVLNLLTGGSIAIYTGMLESSGYTPDDLSPTMKAVIPILLIVLAISVFFIFYFLMFMSVKKSKKIRSDFLHSIGSQPFDRKKHSMELLRSGFRKKEFICFTALTLVCALCAYFYVPVLSFILQPQSIIMNYILIFIIANGGTLRSMFDPAIIMIIINLSAYYVYLTFIVPFIYEKWASERLHIEENDDLN